MLQALGWAVCNVYLFQDWVLSSHLLSLATASELNTVQSAVSISRKVNPDCKVGVSVCNTLTTVWIWFHARSSSGNVPRTSFRKTCYSAGNSNSQVLYCSFPENTALGYNTFLTENVTNLIIVSICSVLFLHMWQKYFSIYSFLSLITMCRSIWCALNYYC